jgi:tetrahydromethanopterin S-methyltransferase subunit C
MNIFEKIILSILWLGVEYGLILLFITSYHTTPIVSLISGIISVINISIFYGFWKNKPLPKEFNYVIDEKDFE